MTLDKLQMSATATVEPQYKVRWLRWWNSSALSKQALRFPKTPSEDRLAIWLNKAAFYAGVSGILFLYNFEVYFNYD
jgi:hypothetical protein